MNLRQKINRICNQLPTGTEQDALRLALNAIVDDLEDHKAKFDAHTHTANDTAVVEAQQFQDVNLQR